jgi:chitin synthase
MKSIQKFHDKKFKKKLKFHGRKFTPRTSKTNMALESYSVAALVIGLTIVVVTLGLFVLFGKVNHSLPFTDSTKFVVKKWLYILFVVALNASGCVLVYYTRNLQVILFLIIALKSKDIIMALMFVVNAVYRFVAKRDQMPALEISDEIERVIAFVPTYKESLEQVARTVDSVIGNHAGSTYVLTFVVSDGVSDFSRLVDDVKFTRDSTYKTWRGKSVGVDIVYGTRGGKPIVLVSKSENAGKKDSIILCNDIFNAARENMTGETNVLRGVIRDDIESIMGVSEFDNIFCTDADTVVSDMTLVCLLDSLRSCEAVAACGVVNVDKTQGNVFWNHLQNFQYLYGQYMRRSNEDVFAQVLCLPGCVSMFKIHPEAAKALTMFSAQPEPSSIVNASVQYVGTDRRFTSCLVYTNPQARVVFDPRVHAYTCPPSSIGAFMNQRRRWCQNMYFNNLLNIVGANISFVMRFFGLVEYLRMTLVYFRLFNTVYFVYLLASSYKAQKVIGLVPYIVVLSYPVVVFFVYSLFNRHLRNQYLSLVLSFLLNRIFTVFSTVVVFTNMLWNIGNESWN